MITIMIWPSSIALPRDTEPRPPPRKTPRRPARKPSVPHDVLRMLTAAVLAAPAACSLVDHAPPAPRTSTSAVDASPTPVSDCRQLNQPIRSPHPAHADADGPTRVSRAVLTLLWTLDTTIDHQPQGQHAASLRAAATTCVTAGFAARLRLEPAIPAPATTWAAWSAHRAYLRVHLSAAHDDGAPPDTAERVLRQWKIVAVPVGRDGWSGAPITEIAFVTVIRGGTQTPWQVNDVRYG